MRLHYYVIDAFAEKPFAGVPVAVFPQAADLPGALRAKLASEMLAADSVFIDKSAESIFKLEAFHQGKATVAGAHAMLAAATGVLSSKQVEAVNGKADFSFLRPEGQVEIFVNEAKRHHPILLSETITPNIDRFTPGPSDIAVTIGLSEHDITSTRYTSLIVSCGKPYLFVPLKSYHALREAAFHTREWGHSSLPQSLVDSLLLFAPNTDGKGGDFHARLLERGSGTTADPAIGEAMPAFAAYLCAQQGVQQGTHSVSVRRGANDARQSLIQLEMDNDGTETLKIRIGGATVVTTNAEVVTDIAS